LSHEKPTEEIRELAALFSLGALTQHEANSFEAHIRQGCPVCEAEYDKFKHITAEIGLSVNETAAPDYVRELILARIERETPEETSETEPESVPEKEEIAAEAPPAPAPRPLLTPPTSQRPNLFPWILVAILAIAGAFGYYAYYIEKIENEALTSELENARTDKANLETSIEAQKSSGGQLEQIIAAVSKPETRILHLAGLEPSPSTSGVILWDFQENKCLIFGYMPPAPQGKSYQLWYLTSNAQIPSGSPEPDPSGRMYSWFPIPEDINNMTLVISLEAEGGAKIPTSPYYAIGRND